MRLIELIKHIAIPAIDIAYRCQFDDGRSKHDLIPENNGAGDPAHSVLLMALPLQAKNHADRSRIKPVPGRELSQCRGQNLTFDHFFIERRGIPFKSGGDVMRQIRGCGVQSRIGHKTSQQFRSLKMHTMLACNTDSARVISQTTIWTTRSCNSRFVWHYFFGDDVKLTCESNFIKF
jgi:hypothetical protein